jgi:hypothetical protein
MKSWNDSVLRVMLDKLSKSEIIELLITNIKVVCGDDEKHLKHVTHEIVCHVQCTEILAGRNKLEDYEPPHRKELFTRLISMLYSPGLPTNKQILNVENEKTVDLLYNDYANSKLDFEAWRKTL